MNLPWHLKYRPKKFKDYTGNANSVLTIKAAIQKKRLPPTIILSGPRGLGKTSLARTISMTLNCKNSKDGEPCIECDNCLKIQSSSNVDVLEIDAASNRGIDSIKQLKNLVQYVTVSGSHRLVILDEVHMLTNEGWNALLKVLEEPPENVVFVLCTTETQNIPQTIFGRAMSFVFQRLPVVDIVNRLEYICKEEAVIYERAALARIAELSNGGMRDSVQMLEQCHLLSGKADLETLTKVKTNVDREDAYFLVLDMLDGNVNSSVKRVDEAASKYSSLFDLFNMTSDIFCELGYCLAGFNVASISDDRIKKLILSYKEKGVKFARVYECIMTITRDLGDLRKAQTASPSLFKVISAKCCWILSGEWYSDKKNDQVEVQEPRGIISQVDKSSELNRAVKNSGPSQDNLKSFKELVDMI